VNAIQPEAIATSLELLMLHRAYRGTLSKEKQLLPILRASALSTERTMQAMGLSISDFYALCEAAAKKIDDIGFDTWIDWSHYMLPSSYFPDTPLPGFVIVDVKLNSGEMQTGQAREFTWTGDSSDCVDRYRIANHRENFWFERNLHLHYGAPDEGPYWVKLPEVGQRVRVRYTDINAKKLSTNTHVYWAQGWINCFGQEMYGVGAWQPLSKEEEVEPVRQLMISFGEK
jgi:hypothetical protein